MKVHLFYLREEAYLAHAKDAIFNFVPGYGNGYPVVLGDETCILYAFTNDIGIAESFVSLRNIDNFIYIKTKMSKKEYHNFCNEMDSAELEMELCSLCKKDFYIALTSYERSVYDSMLEGFYDDFIEMLEYIEVIKILMNYTTKRTKKMLKKSGIYSYLINLIDFDGSYNTVRTGIVDPIYEDFNVPKLSDRYLDMTMNMITMLKQLFAFTMY